MTLEEFVLFVLNTVCYCSASDSNPLVSSNVAYTVSFFPSAFSTCFSFFGLQEAAECYNLFCEYFCVFPSLFTLLQKQHL